MNRRCSQTVSESNLKYLYWTICQQIAHHTISGCNLRCGDLLATGTISGPTADSYGCLLELTRGGQAPINLAESESRSFLEDHDQVTMSAWCQGENYRVGFGECNGALMPSRILDT